jgi:tripartite-type tricarboxylate transporter receptor subunit TctC
VKINTAFEPHKSRCTPSQAIAALVACIGAIASAQAAAPYPDKPIRMLVGFPPGGSTDVLARQIGARLGEALGQQVVIDNRPGATGNMASETVAKANPDGYTLLMATVSSHGINPALFRKVPYDPVKDFQPVTLVATYPLVLAANPAAGARTTRQLIELAKAKPGQIRVASSGNGSPGHLSAEIFKSMSGADLLHIPYKGGAPSTIAVLANEAQVTFATLPGMMPHLKSGRAIALGVTTAARSTALPDVPTIAESGGLAGFDVSSWAGIVLPARTPKDVVARVHREIIKALQSPDMVSRLSAEGANPVGNSPDEFATFIKSELAMWAKAVKQAGTQLD